jgi:hypothetical protein
MSPVILVSPEETQKDNYFFVEYMFTLIIRRHLPGAPSPADVGNEKYALAE